MSTNKQRLKAGLIFGIFYATFFIIEKLVTKHNFSATQVLKYILSGLLEGVITGIIFSWLIRLFNNSRSVKSTTKIETDADEIIFFEGPANHFKGVEAVGGKLYLTNKRLFFKSHKFNVQNHKLSISLNEIMFVNQYKTLGLVNNGLSVGVRGGMIEKFVVNEIEEWIKQLNEKQTSCNKAFHSNSQHVFI